MGSTHQEQHSFPKEKRKVQISGKSSCMVSLPKKWVNEMGLTQGAPLTITRHNGTSLLISVEKSNGGRPAAVGEELAVLLSPSREESPEATSRKIVSLYVQGYDLIKIRLGENPLAPLNKAAIRELVRRLLIGVEIVSDSSDGLILQVLLGKSDLTIENAMKRMSIVASAMQQDAITALRLLDLKRAEDVMEKDEIERFGYYAVRQILGTINHDVFKKGDDPEPAVLAVHLLICQAIRGVASCAKEIAERATSLEVPLGEHENKAIARAAEFASEAFDSAVLSFFKRDGRAAERAIEQARQFPVLQREFVLGLAARDLMPSAVQSLAVATAAASLNKIVRFAEEIAELVLSLTTEQFAGVEDVLERPSSLLVKGSTL